MHTGSQAHLCCVTCSSRNPMGIVGRVSVHDHWELAVACIAKHAAASNKDDESNNHYRDENPDIVRKDRDKSNQPKDA